MGRPGPMIDPLRQVEQVIAEIRDAAADCRRSAGIPCQSEYTWHADTYEAWADHLAAALQPPPVPDQGWRDIETAPERRKVLVSWVNALGKRRTTCAAYFAAGQLDMDDTCDEDEVDEDGHNISGGWFEERETGEPGYYRLNEPLTDWMPLPHPPVETD